MRKQGFDKNQTHSKLLTEGSEGQVDVVRFFQAITRRTSLRNEDKEPPKPGKKEVNKRVDLQVCPTSDG